MSALLNIRVYDKAARPIAEYTNLYIQGRVLLPCTFITLDIEVLDNEGGKIDTPTLRSLRDWLASG